MKPPLVAPVLVVLLAAGCVASPSEPANLGATTPADGPEAAPANATTAPTVRQGLVGPAITQAESIQYFVDPSGPVGVTLRLNGSVLDSRSIEANQTWTIPLPYGRRTLNVTIAGPGREWSDELSLVRLGLATLDIDYATFHPSSAGVPKRDHYDMWVDVDDRPSASQYAAQGATHVDAFTAHDQLVLFEAFAGKKVEYQWSASFRGFSVSRIDGAGNPVTASAPPWWCYTVNGKSANGISIQPVGPGDAVVWTLGTCS